jgi:hypothetical protein
MVLLLILDNPAIGTNYTSGVLVHLRQVKEKGNNPVNGNTVTENLCIFLCLYFKFKFI